MALVIIQIETSPANRKASSNQSLENSLKDLF